MKFCVKCGQELLVEVGIQNTNIAFPVLTHRPLYDNDDQLILVCFNEECEFYGLLQLGKEVKETK